MKKNNIVIIARALNTNLKSRCCRFIYLLRSLLNCLLICLLNSGCASMTAYWNRLMDIEPPQVVKTEPEPPKLVKYSENPQMSVPANNHYRRMTREKLEEESELQAQAGSMWVSEGQSAFLFTQNKARREGDLLAVKMDTPAQRQIETKVGIIKKLLKQLEEQAQREAELRLAEAAAAAVRAKGGDAKAAAAAGEAAMASAKAANGSGGGSSTSGAGGVPGIPTGAAGDRSPASGAAASGVAGAPGAALAGLNGGGSLGAGSNGKNEKEEKTDLSEVQTIQTRIVEKLADGNYKIKGHQPFMIDKKEYKVIVYGIVRPEDFSDDGISAAKLIDAQIDVVSVRRSNL